MFAVYLYQFFENNCEALIECRSFMERCGEIHGIRLASLFEQRMEGPMQLCSNFMSHTKCKYR